MGKKIDYKKLEKEFITNTISLRALAAKHNVAATSVTQYAKKHDWAGKRERLAQKSAEREEKVLERVMIAKEDAWAEAQTCMLRILDKKFNELEQGKCDMTFGQLAKAVKDMKKMGMFGITSAEKKNLAEIKRIEKELAEDGSKDIKVQVIMPDAEDYAD